MLPNKNASHGGCEASAFASWTRTLNRSRGVQFIGHAKTIAKPRELGNSDFEARPT